MHQGRFARAGDAGHRGECAEGNADIDAGEVVKPGALDIEPAYRRPAGGRHADPLFTRQILAGQCRRFADLGRGSLIHELSAGIATRRPELDHPVGRAHRRGIMLDDDDRVPGVRQLAQQAEQSIHIRGM